MQITFKAFLDVITRGRTDEAWVTRVPDISNSPPGYWFGGRYDPKIEDAKSENLYYSLGLIRAGAGQRTLDNWCAGTLIVAEDVGEKSQTSETLRETMGDPTFVIASSKGSAHWGWVLEKPVTDLTLMGRLQRSLTLKFYPKQRDPGHERVIQYLRAPCGINNKPARVAANGGQPQNVELLEWRPGLRYDVLDIMMALDEAYAQTADMQLSASGLSGPATEEAARAYLGSDPILIGLDMAERVDWANISNGYIGLICPWDSDHTPGTEDRSGYNPDMRHFSCYHTAHGLKTVEDVDAWLRANVPGYVAMRYDLVRKAFAASPLPDDDQPAGRGGLVSIWAAPPQKAMPARRSICSHLARGEVTYRIGAPGGGKSAISLAYAVALGADMPKLVGEEAFERSGDVIIVSNEDNSDDYRKRLTGLLMKHGLLGLKPRFDILVTPTQNFAAIERKGGRFEAIELGEDMAWLEAQMAHRPNGVALVILDTQAATFRGVDENSNADMGTAMAKVANWAKRLDVAVEVIQHGLKSNGTSEGGGRLVSARGAGAAGASVRNALTLTTLDKDEVLKLPPGEGHTWVREDGAKGNHSGVRGRKWWQRELADVIVVDEGNVDEATGLAAITTQEVPVYLYREKGPVGLDFEPRDPLVQRQLVHSVAEAERNDDPWRVRKANGGTGLSEALSDQYFWSLEDAKDAILECQRMGNIEQHEWKNPKNRRDVCVWSVTAKGLALLQEGAADVLQDTVG